MKKMRLALMFVALAAISAKSFAAMSLADIRREARFLSDRMGYELGLSNRQYEDVYEINFDFLYQVDEVLDDMVFGYDDAIDYYYYLLDVRNEDLMYVLRSSQYRRFVNRDYFFRPIHLVGSKWSMRIWSRYSDRDYFYFNMPLNYHYYNGAHNRIHFSLSFYADRYKHSLYMGGFRLWNVGIDYHKHDGWRISGKKKYASVSSRPWKNAKNYEDSRRNLKKGYVNVASRDANKRVVKADSEEGRRSSMGSNSASRDSSAGASRGNSSASSRGDVSRSSGSNSRSTSASSSSASRSGNAGGSSVSRSGASGSSSRSSVSGGSSRSGNAGGSSVGSSGASGSSSRTSASGSGTRSSVSSSSSRSTSASGSGTRSSSVSSSSSRSSASGSGTRSSVSSSSSRSSSVSISSSRSSSSSNGSASRSSSSSSSSSRSSSSSSRSGSR